MATSKAKREMSLSGFQAEISLAEILPFFRVKDMFPNRDIIVEDIKEADWDRVLEWLKEATEEYFFEIDSEQTLQEFSNFAEIQTCKEEATVTLWFRFGELWCRSVFWNDFEVEFDFEASDLTEQEDLDSLIGMVRELGRLLEKRVIVCFTNLCDANNDFIFRYYPHTRTYQVRELDSLAGMTDR